ncbi:MAG: DJ-1/PfpI family protein [Oscillospiraceae bacterium]|nr:DJ-1/PfpI family protein [Oscillospiraceae bacterium]
MVYVFLADGFEEVEAMTPIDYLRRAGIEVTLVGVGTAVPKGAHGVSVMTDISEDMFYPDDNTEAVILPGGSPGYLNLSKSEAVRRAIRLGYGETDVLIGAICAAPTILAKEGLLLDKKATCYPDMYEELGDSYVKEDVVTDLPFVTGKSAGVAQEFALKIIEQLRGEEAARKVAEKVFFER